MLGKQIDLKILFLGTIVAGFISSLVKWGSEVNMPPRMTGEISPPAAHIDAWLGPLGVHSNSLDYMYQGHLVGGAVTLYHWIFSFIFAFVYIFLSAFYPKIRALYGVVYGIVITIVMHGFLIPALGFRHLAYDSSATGWLWNLNSYEFFSEILGHIYWSFSIEVSFVFILAILHKPIKGNWTSK
ncbi:DUF1440 domain-containing protein [Acinetobacter boissieri]|uniref:Putative membrane protein n=1 Tax=Acinetobacter boissieri TaxID=1219383 RepID=A0A1G6H226_9GAMM|nr:DUF1440 domain-containing protein [Acinetobacter boissieri]SDB87446.1 putative membrane protein [Acinetobacter boissieri]